MKVIPMLIGQSEVSSGETFEVRDKYSQEVIARLPVCDRSTYESASQATREGHKAVSSMSSRERSEILERISEGIAERAAEFTETICREAGKPKRYAGAEVKRAVETFKFASQVAKEIHGETVPLDAALGSENRIGFFLREPAGPVGAISPFNFPLNLVAHKVAPAIAAGCSVLLKPASSTPLSAYLLCKLAGDCGLPAEAFNVVYGPGSPVGEWIASDEGFASVTFTGSPPVGRRIKELSGFKRVTLELGSNSAAVVDETADLEFALPRLVTGAFAYSGQVCISVQRIYVHRGTYDDFLLKFVEKASELKPGNPLDDATEIGPMISGKECRRVTSWIDEAVDAGARLLCGGKVLDNNIVEPTVLVDVPHEAKVNSNELFGPGVCIHRFDDYDEALRLVNDSRYGLQAGVFTRDVGRAFQAARSLDVGGVIINDYPTYRADNMPYGGEKQSGLGREGVRYAAEEFCRIKMVAFNL